MKQNYLDIFKVTVPQLEELVGTALRYGGSYADLYFENTAYSNLLLKDSEVSSGGFHCDYGVGIRVLAGEKTGYAYSESTEMADMLNAAKAASAIAQGAGISGIGAPVTRIGATKEIISPENYYPIAIDWRQSRQSEFLPFLKKLEQEIISRDQRVAKVIARIANSMSDVLMFNSSGELTFETRPMGSVSVSVIFQQDGQSISTTASRSFRMGAEMIDDDLIYEIADDATYQIDERFEAKRPKKGGQMSVVMGAGASGILLHEAMGHAFEADFNRKGQSVFSDKMGQRICPEGINIVDDATLPWSRGAGTFDDEGVAGEKTYMVTDGILTSYLHDRISAGFYSVAPTGNGRRENFRYNPIPRMRATYMESGQYDPREIIAGVKNGIYVDEFSNGQVKIGEGDFTFFVKKGFLIENGVLTMPVKDINIIGNGPQALADIEMVGNDLIVDESTWTCGKEQSVPVACGIPTVLVKNLTVGGE